EAMRRAWLTAEPPAHTLEWNGPAREGRSVPPGNRLRGKGYLPSAGTAPIGGRGGHGRAGGARGKECRGGRDLIHRRTTRHPVSDPRYPVEVRRTIGHRIARVR